MARKSALGFSGLVGTVVIYEMNGKQYMRARPRMRRGKASAELRAMNTVFGTVSTYGSAMIGQLKDKLSFPFKGNTYNLQRGWMRNQYAAHKDAPTWELQAKYHQLSNLNTETEFRDFLEQAITVTDEGGGTVNVQIPELNPARDLKAPPHTRSVRIKAILVSSPFNLKGDPARSAMETHGFDFRDASLPAHTLRITSQPFTPGDIAMVVIALEFETAEAGQERINREMKWLPAGIVAMGKLR